ncbi:hypothetical protein N9P02_00065 [bacterium]|nr:hypothetical protein [bacterium]
MMKKIILILLLIPLVSFGQNTIYSKDYSGKTVAKDQYGNIIATGQKDYSGAFVWKDQYGNIIKKETIDYLGRNVSKDDKGNTISTGKNNYLGEYEEKDQYGNVIAKYKRNYLGEVEKKDQYGNVIGKYKYNYNGNLEYKVQVNPTYSNPNNNSGAYSNPNNNSGSYANPKIITQQPYQPTQMSPETYAAIGRGLARTLTGFGIYAGSNNGTNFGFDLWLAKKASFGFHYGNTNIPDDQYGINNREEMAVNLGFYLSKKKNLMLKTSWGYTDLMPDFDAYPSVGANQTFDDWAVGFDKFADKGYQDFFYKIGIQLALSKKNKGSGWSPEIYYSNNGIGFGLGFIINNKNPNYPE